MPIIIFENDHLELDIVGNLRLQAKGGGHDLQVLLFNCILVSTAKGMEVDLFLIVHDEIKEMDYWVLTHVQVIFWKAGQVKAAAGQLCSDHRTHIPTCQSIDNFFQIVKGQIFCLNGHVVHKRMSTDAICFRLTTGNLYVAMRRRELRIAADHWQIHIGNEQWCMYLCDTTFIERCQRPVHMYMRYGIMYI